MERRLSAIMSADVVGYSRLMGANEVGTLMALKACRSEAIEPAVQAQGGRVFKLVGDGVLVEFSSVVNAVECATAIQESLRIRNADVPDDRKIELRIGINVGDVIVDEDDVYGDGVNIAARIESVARAGGIAVSQAVRDHVGNRLDVAFQDRGDQQLKNIAIPVRVYDVVSNGGGQSIDLDSSARTLGAKPSIGVLPFDNMSGDPEQDYFSDGICEDIITDLSRLSGLFVVGRNSTFAYKGKSVSLQDTAAELGVAYLLEGSVRKVGQRIRVTAQLIDGITAGHLWAERFDRDLTDIFEIQDEITKAIVAQLKVHLLPDERSSSAPPTDNVEAYNHYLNGRQYYYRMTRSSLRMARNLFGRAVALDPTFGRAHAGIASCEAYMNAFFSGTIPTDEIIQSADRALETDPRLAEAHAAKGQALNLAGRGAEAEVAFKTALSLDPDSYEANLAYAKASVVKGALENAAFHFQRALEIRPEDYIAPIILGQVLRSLGRLDEEAKYVLVGLDRAEEALRREPEEARPAHMGACALLSLGRADEARDWMTRAIAIDPEDSMLRYNCACMAAQLGDVDEALAHLEKFVPYAGQEHKAWIAQDPDMDSLRDHPRFKEAMAAIDRKCGAQAPP
jgi:adenylate cyclase